MFKALRIHHREEEDIPMAVRSVRARVRRGRLELLEKVDLPEGEEVAVTFEMPEKVGAHAPERAQVFDGSALVGPFPLTRAQIYDE